MFNKRTLAIIKRELRERVLSKSFILMTLLIPVFLFGILGLQTFLIQYSGNSQAKLIIVSEAQNVTSNLQSKFAQSDFVKNGTYKISFETMSKSGFDLQLKKWQTSLLGDKLTGIVFIPEAALKNKKIDYYSKTPRDHALFTKLRKPINEVLLNQYFTNKNISAQDLEYMRESVDFNPFKISKNKGVQEEGVGNMILSFLFSFLLYFSLLLLGTLIMRSVVQEKNNRIVEVLLSSASSRELMTGKIIGASITGLLQMAIWLLPLIAVISTTWFTLPAELTLSITFSQILFVLFNFFVGLVTFLGLFAAVGAIFDNDQDAQSGMWPLMMLIMIPFFIAITVANNPGNQIAKIASMLPFASIIVMPARMALLDVPIWQFLIAIVVNVGTMLAIFPIAGKIYRVGILMTGKKPKWSEVIKWVRYKY